MPVNELNNMTEREMLILLVDRMETVTELVKQHDSDIDSLKQTRSEGAGMLKLTNWVIALPGIGALLLAGKEKL